MDCEFQSRKTKQLLHPTFYIFFLTPCMAEQPPPGTKLKGKDDQKDSKHTGKLFVMLLFNIIPLRIACFGKILAYCIYCADFNQFSQNHLYSLLTIYKIFIRS